MNRSLLPLIAGALLALPVTQADAKSYGRFRVGDTFELKVAQLTSTKQVGVSGSPVANRVPANVPKYRKNQTIQFRVRAKGRLRPKGGLVMPFSHTKKGYNEYNRVVNKGPVSITHNAEIQRKGSRAIGGNLNYFVTDDSGEQAVYYTVIYKLRRP